MNPDEVRHNLDEMNRQYEKLMREKLFVKSLIVVGLIGVVILWFVWGLG